MPVIKGGGQRPDHYGPTTGLPSLITQEDASPGAKEDLRNLLGFPRHRGSLVGSAA